MKRICTAILFFLGFTALSAQESFLRHYSINDGLPSSETYSSFQDSQGYIWIASDMGISRFDGYNFKIFTTADGLTDNTVFKFVEDHAGRIWFYTFSGRLSYFYKDSIYGKNFAVNEQVRNFLGSGFINNLLIDAADTVWMASSNGLIKIIPSPSNGQCTWNSIEMVNHLPTFLISNGYATLETYTADSSILRLYGQTLPAQKIVLPGLVSSFSRINKLPGNSILAVYSSSMLVIDSTGRLDLQNDRTTSINFLQENDSLMWICKKHLGVLLCKNSDLLNPLRSFLNTLSVTDVMKDKEGAYWFTTLEDGVYYLPNGQFNYFSPAKEKWNSNEYSFCLAGPQKLWVMSGTDLYQLSGTNRFNRLIKEEDKFTGHDNLRFLNAFNSSEGQLWVSANLGVIAMDEQHIKTPARIISLAPNDKTIADSRILLEDRDHNIWSLNHTALFKIDAKTKKVVKTWPVPSRAETICEDGRGRLLIGTVNGLYRLTGDTFTFMGKENSIFKNRFVDLKNRSGLIAGATRGAGLIILKGDSIYQITTGNGLRSNMCRAVFIDDRNIIWLATNNGLSGITIGGSPSKPAVQNFSVADGLPSNDIEQVLRIDEQLWLLTKKGIVSFNPDKVISNNFPPPVYITQLKIDNIARSPKQDTTLSHTTNFIGIDFVGLTYKNAGKQSYKYMLQGYDTGWTYTTNTFVQFTKLPPGNYSFKVLCVNNAGTESSRPAVYRFTINTPFYRQTWFAVLLFFSAVFLVIIISVHSVKRIRKREESKTELNRKIANLELQALRAQMNPHFIFNCLNAIQDFILKNDAFAAKHYLTSFSKLIRKTLDNSRRQSIRLKDEIDFLNLYLELESMRFTNKFNYKITLHDDLENKNIQIPAMILQPFIENAVRHSRIGSLPAQGELNITFSLRGSQLVCIIDDNGIGLKQSLKLKGEQPETREAHALDMINERIASMNEVHHSNISYTIIDKSDILPGSSGTRVEIEIPLE